MELEFKILVVFCPDQKLVSRLGYAAQIVGVAPEEPQKVGKNVKISHFDGRFSYVLKIVRKCKVLF